MINTSTVDTVVNEAASGLTLRPAAQRGMADHGWLKSAHTFSFASYYDLAHLQFNNLRVINDDEVAAGRGFGAHPHQDAEIFSYVLEGALEHKDSMGNGSTVTAGGVQYMSAGTGVQHSEYNPSQTERVRFLQVWLRPNTTGEPPHYATQQIANADKDGKLHLFLSADGRDGSMRIKADADIYAATLHGTQLINFDLLPNRQCWIQVARGTLVVNDQPLSPGDGLAITRAGNIILGDGDRAEILLFDLEAT